MLKVFISYPRVLQQFCLQIHAKLESYDVWIDQRLYAGQQWWTEITNQIDQCHAFVCLLSDATLASHYCMKELKLAAEKHKAIIPIKCEDMDSLPEWITQYQMIDMAHGMTIPAISELFCALVEAERKMRQSFAGAYSGARGGSAPAVRREAAAAPLLPPFDAETLIKAVVKAQESGDYDHAILLMEEARNRRMVFIGFDLENVLRDAKARREQRAYQQGRESEYRGIAAMIASRDAQVRELGMRTFHRYRQVYPDYDPLNLSERCLPLLLPEIRWCPVRSGEVVLRYPDRKASITHYVPAFNLSKYPITNAQFQIFADAPDGYAETRWWSFSVAAKKWRAAHARPLDPRSPYGDHPRVNVTWFEAMAFCNWLSYKTGWRITLPTEPQWQRAAQGDDQRQYPWGQRFERNRHNGKEARIDTTSAVGRFVGGASPFEVMDMAGNCWEYTRTLRRAEDSKSISELVAKGGSYASAYNEVRTTARTHVKAGVRFGTVGFRAAVNLGV